MREVFVSYAHQDNQPNPDITHEHTKAVEHFVEVYKYVNRTSPGGAESDIFFIDRTDIRLGEYINESIRSAIAECSVMLAFISPAYFSSQYCLQEWKEFKRLQREEVDVRAAKLLIPIEVHATSPETVPHLDSQTPEWIQDLLGADGLKRAVDSAALLDFHTERLAEQLEVLDAQIQEHILIRRGSSGNRRSASNILCLKNKILGRSLNTPELAAELYKGSTSLKYDQLRPVCVIYAGGTIGMIHQKNSDRDHPDFEMAAAVENIVDYVRPRLLGLHFNMHFLSLAAPIDSSNVSAQDWVNLASLISEQMDNYQGFVILHGTNTLAYTASALSFLLQDCIRKPVVITGAEVPLSVENTDAAHNIENAIRAAAWETASGPVLIAEVTVFWGDRLYRGNRVAKKYASHRTEGFHTPNMAAPLAVLANEKLSVEHDRVIVRPDGNSRNSAFKQVVDISDARVDIMFIHPGVEFEDLLMKYPPSLDGLILLSYGPGNIPEDPRFIAMIENLLENGTIVCNVTQCPYGPVEIKLFETNATLFDLGVVDAYDMTLEAAYTKLLWAVSRRKSRKLPGVQSNIKRTFQRNIAGEMSASIQDVSFGASDTFEPAGSNYQISDMRNLEQKFDQNEIENVFVRLEGVTFPPELRTGEVRLLLGRPSNHRSDLADEIYQLASFRKELTEAEVAQGQFDKNFEITSNFRKWYNNDEFQLSICLVGSPEFHFSSLRMVVYTKSPRL